MTISTKIQKRRDGNIFNLLRLLLAVTVILSHSPPLLYGIHHLDPVARWTRWQFDQPGDHAIDAGHIAVYCFFIISGILVTSSWQHSRGLLDFLKKRILRIYPGYLVATMFCLLVAAPIATDNLHAYFHYLWWMKRFLVGPIITLQGPGLLPVLNRVPIPYVINGSVWTIEYEFGCYLTVAILGLCALVIGKRLPFYVRRPLPFCFFCICYLLYSAHCAGHLLGWMSSTTPEIGGLIINYPRLLTYFSAGMCLCLYKDLMPRSRWLFFGAIIGLVLAARVVRVLPYVLPVFGSYCLWYVAYSRTLSEKWRLARFGSKLDLSYGTYLYAFPVQQLLVQYTKIHAIRINAIELFLLACPIALCLAALSWRLVEEPCLRLKPKPQVAPEVVPADPALHEPATTPR